MSVQVRITTRFDNAGMADFVATTLAPSIQKAAGAVRDMAGDYLTAAGRRDTGNLIRTINAETVRTTGRGVSARVVSDQPYSKFVHDGTRSPILPRRARVLRFVPKGGRGFVYARQVSGIAATPFLTEALKRVRASDFT